MKTTYIKTLMIAVSIFLFDSLNVQAQCNTNTAVCSNQIAGPFNFTSAGQPVSSCLDFYGSGYAYILLHITNSGPLKMLIDGNASSGFLDVAIFNVPTGSDPCEAILNSANEISCNYASSASGCNQIGNYFSCSSSVPSPYVNSGDVLMIVVENWSSASTNFTLELAPHPAAQSGPGNATINQPPVLQETDPPFQLSSADSGGTWSGTGVSSNGMFDPSISGPGQFDVVYSLGSGPCEIQDTASVTVEVSLPIVFGGINFTCLGDETTINWQTLSEKNCDYFEIEISKDGVTFESIGKVKGFGTTNSPQKYAFHIRDGRGANYVRLREFDLNGLDKPYGPFAIHCPIGQVELKPNPARETINISYVNFQPQTVRLKIYDQYGRIISDLHGSYSGETKVNVESLERGIYLVEITDDFTRRTKSFIRI